MPRPFGNVRLPSSSLDGLSSWVPTLGYMYSKIFLIPEGDINTAKMVDIQTRDIILTVMCKHVILSI